MPLPARATFLQRSKPGSIVSIQSPGYPSSITAPPSFRSHLARQRVRAALYDAAVGRDCSTTMRVKAKEMTLRSILIVDDEENQRFVVEQALRSTAFDWNICTAASGHEALESLAGRSPDLVITDYNMPYMNGLDLVAHIRRRQIDTRIILMTAYSSPEMHAAARRLKIDYCLIKPVRLNELRRLATTALEG